MTDDREAGQEAKTGRTWPDLVMNFAKFLIPAGLVLVVALILVLVVGKAIDLGSFGRIQIADATAKLTPFQIEPPGRPETASSRFPAGGWSTDGAIPNGKDYAFCTISGVWITPATDGRAAQCELYIEKQQWLVKVSTLARCQVTCFK
jgi:hypothetical protein